jgi:hypothetical protein
MAVSVRTQVCGQCGYVLAKSATRTAKQKQGSDAATGSLVLGILGVTSGVVPLVVTGVVFVSCLALIPILAVVTGNLAKRKLAPSSLDARLAKVGTNLGIVALAIDGFWLLWLLSRLGD